MAVGAGLSDRRTAAKAVNANAFFLEKRGALESIAAVRRSDKPAPTGIGVPRDCVKNLFLGGRTA